MKTTKRQKGTSRPGKPATDWAAALAPLLKKYGGRKHPLDYRNLYELIVVVILSSQMTDDRINALSPAFFKRYPTLNHLARAKPEDLYDILRPVRGSKKKAAWLVGIAQSVGDDAKLPRTMDALTELPGIGRKSANVIIRESGGTAEGIIVDLHVLRVVPRLGIAHDGKPDAIEETLMELLPPDTWNSAGMSFSFLGRELCRPTDPHCGDCVLNSVCQYYRQSRR